MQKGVTVWLTGLSGSGKTTISQLVETRLKTIQIKVELIDGDIFREQFASDLGFSKEERRKNIERASRLCHLLTRNDVIVLASFITPYRNMRDLARKNIGSFLEVYVKCPLEECVKRDVKGLYKKALAGEIQQFTGISDPFEEPEHPELVLETDRETAEESAEKIVRYLLEHQYLPMDAGDPDE